MNFLLGSGVQITSKRKFSTALLKGFSRYSARSDVESAFAPFTVKNIDPILDEKFYPTGKFIVECATVYDIKKMNSRLAARFGSLYNLYLDYEIPTPFQKASKLNITPCSIKISLFQKFNTQLDCAALFEDFDIVSSEKLKSVELQPTADTNTIEASKFFHDYIVNFSSPEEAERAVSEYNGINVNGCRASMFWYQC
jgi:hypothetical protein